MDLDYGATNFITIGCGLKNLIHKVSVIFVDYFQNGYDKLIMLISNLQILKVEDFTFFVRIPSKKDFSFVNKFFNRDHNASLFKTAVEFLNLFSTNPEHQSRINKYYHGDFDKLDIFKKFDKIQKDHQINN